MPERPVDPRDAGEFLNKVLERLRAVEREVLRLPDGAEPLQGFEDGSPLGDVRFLDFRAGIRAAKTGDGYVSVSGGGGGGGWGNRYKTGFYYRTPHFLEPSDLVGISSGTLYCMPFFASSGHEFDRIAINVSGVGGVGAVARLGIYEDDGFGYPGALLADYGTVIRTSTGVKEITISQVLDEGLYWLAIAPQVAGGGSVFGWSGSSSPFVPQASAASTARASCYTEASVTGALPATFTTSVTTNVNAHNVELRAI